MSKNPKSIFPKEVINFSVEDLLQKRSKRSLVIYKLLLLSIVCLLGLLPLIEVDVSLNAVGSVQSKKLETTIPSSVNGIVKRVFIKKNQYVEKGDTLFIFNADLIEQEIKVKSGKLVVKLDEHEDLQHLSTNLDFSGTYKLKTTRLQKEYIQLQSSLSELRAQLYVKNKIYERERSFHEAKFSSDAKLETVKLDVDLLINQIEIMRDKFVSSWIGQLQSLNFELDELRLEISNLHERRKNYTITAQQAGHIKSMEGLQKGSSVFANQNLATISPNKNLILECYVKPADIGLIKQGQKVNIRVDAYNYQQWGLMEAEVEEVINDIVLHNEQTPFFVVRCKPNQTFLELDNGVKGELKKGMSFQSNFIIARRSLFDLLFDKVENWLAPTSYQS